MDRDPLRQIPLLPRGPERMARRSRGRRRYRLLLFLCLRLRVKTWKVTGSLLKLEEEGEIVWTREGETEVPVCGQIGVELMDCA